MSTTHTITGAIIGVGSTNRFSAVRWGLTGRVLYAWIITIPGAAAIAAFSYVVLQVAPASIVAVIGLGAAFSWGVFFLIRKRRALQETVFAPPAQPRVRSPERRAVLTGRPQSSSLEWHYLS